MSWQRISRVSADGLGPYAKAWDRLNQRLNGGHLMLGTRFVRNLIQEFSKGHQHLLIGRRDGACAVPCIVEPRMPTVWRSFLPSSGPGKLV